MADYVNYVIRIEIPFDTQEEAQSWTETEGFGKYVDSLMTPGLPQGATMSGTIKPGYHGAWMNEEGEQDG